MNLLFIVRGKVWGPGVRVSIGDPESYGWLIFDVIEKRAALSSSCFARLA